MRKFLWLGYSFFCVIILGGLIFIHLNLQIRPQYVKLNGVHYDAGHLALLFHLDAAIENGAADAMQNFFPEGYFFQRVMHGLAWAETAGHAPTSSSLFKHAEKQVNKAIKALREPHARDIFPADQPILYGAFYQSWLAWLEASALEMYPSAKRPGTLQKYFRERCISLSMALDSIETPFPPSYIGQSWPADITVGIAALAACTKMFPEKYDTTISEWVHKTRARLDSFGLIPHKTHTETGEAISPARGSSSSLMLCFLPEIDKNFAQEVFEAYEKILFDKALGLPGIREYPKPSEALGDVDSGPVLLGIGSVASIVGRRALAVNGRPELGRQFAAQLEGFGFPKFDDDGKTYLFGGLPMVDAFIAWVNSPDCCQKLETPLPGGWQTGFRLWSIAIFVVLSGIWVAIGFPVFFPSRKTNK